MDDASSVVEGELEPGERILWSGKPRQGLVLRGSDALLIPFSLLWTGFAFFWEGAVVTSNGPAFFKFWGIPFVLAGLYITVGRFFADAWRRGQTVYAVTDDRVIVLSRWFGHKVQSLSLRSLTDVSMTQKADGSGTISFSSTKAGGWWANASWPGASRYIPPSFELIPDVRYVYDLIRRAQREA